ncbi:MAG: DUF2892 domain-containing protein [Dehalococcoidia bacterium]|nr:DUF2892 domain-containing protein [Dehalococcoidia bacterium]
MGIATFMASTAGRLARIVAGIVLIAVGFMVGGTAGWVIGIVGLVPIAAGAANVCLLAPILGAPFKGSDVSSR